MLQKAGWRIKQLISNRGNRDIESQEERARDSQVVDKETIQRQSWASQSPSQEVAVALRRTISSATRIPPLPLPGHPPMTTAHSSASSLCSCECGVHIDCDSDAAGNKHYLSKVLPGTRQLNPNPDVLYLPSLKSSISLGTDAKTWGLLFSGSPPKAPVYSSQRYIFEAQKSSGVPTGLDLLEALAIDPQETNTTPTQSVESVADLKMEDFAGNVEKLMREADAAFEAVGTALADAKAATERLENSDNLTLMRRISISRKASTKHHRPTSPLKTHPSRSRTVSKSKRKKKAARKQAKLLSRPARMVFASTTAPAARWTLTDMTSNMADVFSTKMFRTEVDEMLTPERIQQLREDNRSRSALKSSSESSRSIESASTQTEPFYLEGVASRIDAMQANSSPFAEPVLPPPANPPTPPIPRKNSLRRKCRKKVELQEPPVENIDMMFKDLSFPSPPHSQESISNGRGDIPLNTIPEVSPLNTFISPSPPPIIDRELPVLSEPEYIFLQSTNFTLTSPLFHHGPIRLNRPLRKREGSFPNDDSLDWTAFQMAISGGVDEDEEVKKNSEWEAYQDNLDGMLEWWEEFGFESAGELIGESKKVRKKGRKVDIDWYEMNTGGNNETVPVEEPQMRCERTLHCREARSERKPANWQPQLPVLRREIARQAEDTGDESEYEVESLPPSPMLELVVPSPSRKHLDVPPMGFNLGHDLGDFLKWDTQHRQCLFVDNW